MNRLFEESTINGISLKNRFVRSATWEGLATQKGEATPKLIERMAQLAKGGVGLIISSHAFVSPEGQGTPWQLGIYNDELIPKLKEMTSAVHAHGGKIMAQLAHAGQHAEEKITGLPAFAVSNSDDLSKKNVKILSPEDIRDMVDSFAKAATRAKDADFDGIEIHSGHGYLLSQFLSPAYNKRTDTFGGSVDNRARIHIQICQAIRNCVGKDYPIIIKMNGCDFIENGLTIDDSLSAAKLFAQAGFDAIELSGGTIRTGKLSPTRMGISTPDKEAYFKDQARRFKSELKIPIILVGGLRSYDVADTLIREGIADYISMSRPFIREPDLIDRWKRGIRHPAECKSDNLCFNPGFEGKGVYCVTREIEEKRMGVETSGGRFS